MGKLGARWWTLVALVALALSVLGGVALAARTRTGVHKLKHHSALPAKRVLADQSGKSARVIVLLRNQNRNLPPTARFMRARAAALGAEQGPLVAAVRGSGGRVTHAYRTINAFSAVLSRSERARLASNSAVAEILPDGWVPAPAPADTTTPRTSTTGSTPSIGAGANGDQQICPTNPADPIVAPEGLKQINAPQAQQIVSGAGVKVAFVAEGIDVNNPDFIRPDGSHVIVDYRDFTGQGTDSQTTGAEAFGDASTIAAQGDVPHDLSQFVNASHPLPPGCNIVLRGVAPGASLVAMKVFPTINGEGTGAFTSTIIQGEDWAVAVDHVNVLNESWGGDELPDTDQDLSKAFNTLAEQAGTVVTTSSGDQGTQNTIGSPASGPSGISAGSTTQFQGLAQTTRGGYQLGSGGWENDNIAAFSSAGFTQGGKTMDLVAPGNESYEACTPTSQYLSCKNLNGAPSSISTFGGTSESAPMTAGVAALVIQAYRETHRGQSPSPALIKQLIISNSNDLNIPSYEQGAGELDALAAVKAAESYGRPATGNGWLVDPTQLDLQSPAGTQTGSSVTVTNDGSSAETVSARMRTIGATLSEDKGQQLLDAATDPTYLDYKGVPQAFVKRSFSVPAGADRLDASIAWPGPSSTVNLTLFDPSGKMAAFTYQANGETPDYGTIDVRNPEPGPWTAVFETPQTANGYTGEVNYDFVTQKFTPVGNVSPAAETLRPGQTGQFHVSLPAPAPAGDYGRDLVLSSSTGKTTVVPVVMRSLVPLNGGQGSFAGAITGGDGDGLVAREDTFAFNVPAGAPAVNVQFNLPSDPNTEFEGFLVSPDGQALGMQEPTESSTGAETMQLFQRDPAPGQWRFVVSTFSPVGGTTTSGLFTGTVSLHGPPVTASGVPDSRHAVIPAGGTATAAVTVTNNGNAPMVVSIDPRLTQTTDYPLTAVTQATGVPLPLNTLTAEPLFIVPTESNRLFAAAQATAPILFDWGFGDPDLISTRIGDTASGQFSSPEATPGLWGVSPALIGPFSAPASATVNVGMTAQARVFDTNVSSSTGDVEYYYVNPSSPPPTPETVNPGQTVTIPVTFTAGSGHGFVTGDLIVDDNFLGNFSANELRAIPYEYRVK